MMKSTATQRNVSRRKSAECTGLRIEMTRIDDATATVPTMRKMRKTGVIAETSANAECRMQNAECRGAPLLILHSAFCIQHSSLRSSLDPRHVVPVRQLRRLRAVLPILELLHIEVEIVAVVRRELVRLRRQPDRLRLRRAGLFAKRAEHAALDVDVVAVEDLHLLLLAVDLTHLVVDVDVDDVDGARHRAELAGDAAVEGEAEHAAEAVGRLEALFRIADRHLRLPELAPGGPQPLEEIEEEELIAPTMLRILDLHEPPLAAAGRDRTR